MNEELELDIDELRAEADQLGIKYPKTTGAVKLKAKIDEYYESQETSGKEIQEAVAQKEQAEEKSEEKSAVSDNKDKALEKKKKIAAAKERANKTRIVTIIDNDQRVNNQVTTCKVTCANMYFDLGTMIIPLNMAVEVKQGHIDVLKDVKIPQHTKDPKTGLSSVRLVPRYTVVYEQMD